MLGEADMITDFSPGSKSVVVLPRLKHTDLYFKDYKSLQEVLGHWRGKLFVTCCEEDADLFDPASHVKLVLTFRDDDVQVKIEVEKRRK